MNYIKLVEVEDELFDRNLLEINSLDKAENYVDEIYKAEMLESFDTLKYVEVVSGFAKKRFYHGLSHYNIYENWIAVLAGKVFWTHMSAIVNSDDILKYPYGLCSQQTIVFMELLKRKDILINSLRDDKVFVSKYGISAIKQIEAHMLTYLAIHLILIKNKKTGLYYFLNGISKNKKEIFTKRSLAIFKHLLLN